MIWRERTVAGAGLDLAVFEAGDPTAQETVVLVHGYPDTHVLWDPVAERLADRAHLVAYDVRGSGASGVPATTEGYALDLLVQDLEAVLDATAPGRRVHLVGHDWGSVQLWEAVCTDRPAGRIATFTSISGPCLDHIRPWAERRLRSRSPRLVQQVASQAPRSLYVGFFQVPAVPEAFWRGPGERAFRRLVGAREPGHHVAPTMGDDAARGVNLYRANRGRLRDPQPRRTDLPVLVLVPEDDPAVTPGLTEDVLLHAPNAERRVVPGGHWLPATDPDLVADAVAGLIGRGAGR